jgi:anaerobic sulfite reductase subunit B
MNIFQHKLYTITEVQKQNHDNILFSIDCDINPYPGQFVQVNVPGLGEAPISTASFNGKELQLNIRVVGNVTYAMTKLKKGDKISLRGPYGQGFPMHHFEGNNIILIGGGCGVAPLKGVIDYLDANREKYHDIIMFFGYRSPKDILFKHHMDGWQEKFIYNMTVDENPEKIEVGCPTGFVTSALEKYEMNNENKIVLMCGPEIMMKKTVEILKKKGFNDDQIFLSYERHMKCCTGRCGHCMIKGTYVCKDGPVFRWDFAKELKE